MATRIGFGVCATRDPEATVNVRLFASTDTRGITSNIRKNDLYIHSLNKFLRT